MTVLRLILCVCDCWGFILSVYQ